MNRATLNPGHLAGQEPGDFEVGVGSSAQQIELRGKLSPK